MATRKRIIVAAVGLHGSIGPLATTITAIAQHAGVERETVYRHFPDEASLFAACTAHHLTVHPGPALEAWVRMADPRRRLVRALSETYAHYADIELTVASILRDAEVAPDRVGSSFTAFHAAARAVLLEGWRLDPERRKPVRAAIGHALRFHTWRSLVREEGLSGDGAVRLMMSLVTQAARGPSTSRA